MALLYLLLLFLVGDLKKRTVCANRNNPTEMKQLMAEKRGNGQRNKVWVKVKENEVQSTNAGICT